MTSPASALIIITTVVSNNSRGLSARSGPGCYDIAHVVYQYVAEIQFPELAGDILGALAFLEWRRGDLADRHQLVVRESIVLLKEIESSADLRRGKQIRYSR